MRYLTTLLILAFSWSSSLNALHMDELHQLIDNLDTEVRMLHERVQNQDLIMDSFRDEIMDLNALLKERTQANAGSLETRISTMEASLKGVTTDIRQLREHSNESSKLLNQYKEKIVELTENINTLHAALESIVGGVNPELKKEYVVVSGDSLEKIARKNNTTIKKIKSLNALKSDKIFIGQRLKLQ